MDYLMVRPSLVSTIAFLVIVVAVAMAFPAAVWQGTLRANGPGPARRSALRACWATLAVLAISAALAESGLLGRAPRGLGVMAYFVLCNGGAALLAFSTLGQRMAQSLPLYALVGFHVFRLPLELVLHQWYMEGVLPVQMTYAGQNFDIVTGLLSLFIAPLMYYGKLSRRAAWFFNLVGAALLVNVASIAVRSSPVPLRTYMNEPPVLLALHAPFTWIVPICVSGALFGHLITFRRLFGSEPELLGASGA
jgi:hypothetical protein